MNRVDVGGFELRIDVQGSGPHNFLCLHGLVDRLEIWDALAQPLAKRGRMVRIDQRGHGESDAPDGPYSREDLANDAIRVLDALEIDRAILIAHSMGGVIAMTAALEHPDRVAGLLLIGTTGRCNEKVAGWYDRIARAGETDGIDGLRKAIYGEKSGKSIVGDAQGIAHVTRTLASLYSDPLLEKLNGLACPTLLLVGEKDPMGPRASEILAERIGDARLRVVPECGHWVHVDAAQEVLEDLDPWLRDMTT